jgi:hypothetical protein
MLQGLPVRDGPRFQSAFAEVYKVKLSPWGIAPWKSGPVMQACKRPNGGEVRFLSRTGTKAGSRHYFRSTASD